MAKKSILSGFMNTDVKQLSFDNQIQNIHYLKIRQSSKNRGLRRIEELAEDIAEDGLEDNLVVRKIEDEDYDYDLIAGHRRYNAILHNINAGDKTYEYIPCKIVTLSDVDARKRLILNNYQNDPLTSAEKLDAVEELRDIYRSKKAAGEKIPGRIQNIIADEIGLKKSQVANYEKILNNAVPEVRNLIKNEEMTIETAAELAGLESEEQKRFIEQSTEFTKKDLKEFKKESQLTFDENDEIVEEDIREKNSYYDEIDEEEYTEPLKEYRVKNHHKTIEDSLTIVCNEIEYLKEKICGIEFKDESEQLVKLETSLHTLLHLLGLECSEK